MIKEDLREIGDGKLDDEEARRENTEKFLDVKHVELVPVAVEPSGFWLAVRVDEAIH